MKAAVVNAENAGFDIEDVEIDEPIGHEVLVEVKASGLCHSDLHMMEGGWGIPLPAVMGHELAGVVKKLGPDVTEFAIGDHVVGSLVKFCGHCGPCRDGRSWQCADPDFTLRSPEDAPRLSRKGEPLTAVLGTSAFAEYTLVHENQLVKVPSELPFAQASILGCGCVTGAGAAINSAGIRPGDTVAIMGVGGVGLNIVTGAKLAGAGRIIAIDLKPEKEALARKFGATDFLVSTEGDIVETVKQMTGGGVDHAFEVVGFAVTTRQVIRMPRKGGTAYLLGLHTPGKMTELDISLDLIINQTTVRGVFMGSTNIKHDIPMYADLYLQGRFNLDDLISREINISEINEAYAELKSGAIARSVITSF